MEVSPYRAGYGTRHYGDAVKQRMRWTIRIAQRGQEPRTEGEYVNRSEAEAGLRAQPDPEVCKVIRVAVYR